MNKDHRLAPSPIGRSELCAVGDLNEIADVRFRGQEGGMGVQRVIGHASQEAGADYA